MTSPQYGALFEAAIIDEALKTFHAEGRPPQLSFWRDGNKNEIDLLVQRGLRAVEAVEIKSLPRTSRSTSTRWPAYRSAT